MRIRDIFFRHFWWKLASLVLAALIWFNYEFPRGRSQIPDMSNRKLELAVIPLASAGDVRQFKTDPPTVTVHLEGEANELKYIEETEILAFVVVAEQARTNGALLKVEVSGLPPGVSKTAIVPERVKIYTPPGS